MLGGTDERLKLIGFSLLLAQPTSSFLPHFRSPRPYQYASVIPRFDLATADGTPLSLHFVLALATSFVLQPPDEQLFPVSPTDMTIPYLDLGL